MVNRSLLTFVGVFFSFTAAASSPKKPTASILDLPIGGSGTEYRPYSADLMSDASKDPLQKLLAIGTRNLDWLDFINSQRDPEHLLELSTPSTTRAYPIEAPAIYSRTIILNEWEQLVGELPELIHDVLIDSAAFTADLGMTDEEFLQHVRLVDRIYQTTSRWLLMEPSLDYYKTLAAKDLRAYYFLKKEPDLLQKLAAWSILDEPTRSRLSGWLRAQCQKRSSAQTCKNELQQTIDGTGSAQDFYTRYEPTNRSEWEGYFKIGAYRDDITWSSAQPEIMSIPFRNPNRDDVLDWLKTNIEDEFHQGLWQLKLNFKTSNDPTMTHVVFQPGATPHVNGIGGNIITMDANRNIKEYLARWTIRHEYGHVLGLRDCYLEFYDSSLEAMVNYQLDITNLMCSRRGHFLDTHFEELKKAYYR